MAQNTEELQKFPKIAWSSLPSATVDSKGQSRPSESGCTHYGTVSGLYFGHITKNLPAWSETAAISHT